MRKTWLGLAAAVAAAGPPALTAQALPFGPGEALVYEVRVAPMGRVGQGTLRVEGPDALRGREVYVLRFDLDARVGPLTATQESGSWLDPERFTALRFHKREAQPLARDRAEEVEIYPDERRWHGSQGEAGSAPTAAPLDELSLLYYVRLLALEPGQEVRLERHFDPARNPVLVRAIGREVVDVPAGRFSTILVEMRVRDPARYRGEGRIRLNIVEDERRTPVRIRTTLPDAGTITLELRVARPASPGSKLATKGREGSSR